MEWRIRESGHGGFVAEKGIYHKGGESFPGIIGVTMPAFVVYESAHFQTEKEAKNYIKRRYREKF